VTAPAVLLLARFDDALHAHAAQRGRALERLGCRVTVCDPTRRPSLVQRLLGGDRVARVRAALAEANPDLVLVTGRAGLTDGLLAELRTGSGVTWVNWFPEDLRRAGDAAAWAGAFDQVFVVGTDVAAVVGERLGRPVEVLPFGADPSVYRPRRSRDQYRANVVFAGAASRRREGLLAGLVEFGLALWGPGWRDTTLRDYCRGETLRTDEYVRACNGATVAINIHHEAENAPVPESSCNQRVFELAAMGVPQLVDLRADLPAYFTVGQDVLTYRTGEDLRDLVRELLLDPSAVEALGASARRVVLERHTYMHRMRRLLEAVGPAPAA
jgi:spore maturation protein CgeB